MKYYIRRKPDGQLVAIRYKGEQEANDIVDYLNSLENSDDYYCEAE
jgi:hypothetical protein